MRFNVITIARTLGAGGEDLGERLADELGFRYVDDEILDRAAVLAGVTTAEVAQAEARPGLVDRMMAALRESPSAEPSRDLADREPGAPGYSELIVDVIKETAAMEFVVIVAHGAAVPLAGRGGVLRVLVTASEATRASRVAASHGVPLDLARKQVEESDAGRAAFFLRFYELTRESPTTYDIVINTDALSVEEASNALLTLVRG